MGNQTHGYWSGGTQVPASTPSGSTGHGAHTRIARFTYASDTHSNVGTIPAPRKLVAASGNATEGYLYGGLDGHPAPAKPSVMSRCEGDIWLNSDVQSLIHISEPTRPY